MRNGSHFDQVPVYLKLSVWSVLHWYILTGGISKASWLRLYAEGTYCMSHWTNTHLNRLYTRGKEWWIAGRRLSLHCFSEVTAWARFQNDGVTIFEIHLTHSIIWQIVLSQYYFDVLYTGIILCMRPANGRRRYNVTSSLIGWAHKTKWSLFIILYNVILFVYVALHMSCPYLSSHENI